MYKSTLAPCQPTNLRTQKAPSEAPVREALEEGRRGYNLGLVGVEGIMTSTELKEEAGYRLRLAFLGSSVAYQEGQVDVERELKEKRMTLLGHNDAELIREHVDEERAALRTCTLFDRRSNYLVIAFRGTVDTAGWIANLSAGSTIEEELGVSGGLFHAGFSRLASLIAHYEYAGYLKENPSAKLILCGHSLGAALASTVAVRTLLRLTSTTPPGVEAPIDRLFCIGFAAPPICDFNAAEKIHTRYWDRFLFVTNYEDPILLTVSPLMNKITKKFERQLKRGLNGVLTWGEWLWGTTCNDQKIPLSPSLLALSQLVLASRTMSQGTASSNDSIIDGGRKFEEVLKVISREVRRRICIDLTPFGTILLVEDHPKPEVHDDLWIMEPQGLLEAIGDLGVSKLQTKDDKLFLPSELYAKHSINTYFEVVKVLGGKHIPGGDTPLQDVPTLTGDRLITVTEKRLFFRSGILPDGAMGGESFCEMLLEGPYVHRMNIKDFLAFRFQTGANQTTTLNILSDKSFITKLGESGTRGIHARLVFYDFDRECAHRLFQKVDVKLQLSGAFKENSLCFKSHEVRTSAVPLDYHVPIGFHARVNFLPITDVIFNAFFYSLFLGSDYSSGSDAEWRDFDKRRIRARILLLTLDAAVKTALKGASKTAKDDYESTAKIFAAALITEPGAIKGTTQEQIRDGACDRMKQAQEKVNFEDLGETFSEWDKTMSDRNCENARKSILSCGDEVTGTLSGLAVAVSVMNSLPHLKRKNVKGHAQMSEDAGFLLGIVEVALAVVLIMALPEMAIAIAGLASGVGSLVAFGLSEIWRREAEKLHKSFHSVCYDDTLKLFLDAFGRPVYGNIYDREQDAAHVLVDAGEFDNALDKACAEVMGLRGTRQGREKAALLHIHDFLAKATDKLLLRADVRERFSSKKGVSEWMGCSCIGFIVIHELRKLLRTDICIGVVGETKAGKSTLLNKCFNFDTKPGPTHTKEITPYFVGQTLTMIDFPGGDDSRFASLSAHHFMSALVIASRVELGAQSKLIDELTASCYERQIPCLVLLTRIDQFARDYGEETIHKHLVEKCEAFWKKRKDLDGASEEQDTITMALTELTKNDDFHVTSEGQNVEVWGHAHVKDWIVGIVRDNEQDADAVLRFGAALTDFAD
jgi:hypothetical protein